MTLYDKLGAVQSALKAPKGQENRFGGYRYRSCEDILEALKPLLRANGLVLTISDEIVTVGERTYVRACATVTDGESAAHVYGYAREPESRKGMDEAQVTGSSSSYARKYALNGLFCIDDTRDPDATNTHGKAPTNPQPKVEAKVKAQVEGSSETAGSGRDFSQLSALAERFAAATGQTVADAKRSFVKTYGDPREMPDAKYRAVLMAIESNIRSLEGPNG